MLDFEHLPRFKHESYKIITMIPEWARAFEAEDRAIIRQLHQAHAWILCNPRHAPRNVVRFLFNWMTKAKKMGNLVTEHKNFKAPEADGEVMTDEDWRKIREGLRK